jgi:hypothetical protein
MVLLAGHLLRPKPKDKTAWSRRKVILDELKRLIARGRTEEAAVAELEALRAGRHLRRLIDDRCHIVYNMNEHSIFQTRKPAQLSSKLRFRMVSMSSITLPCPPNRSNMVDHVTQIGVSRREIDTTPPKIKLFRSAQIYSHAPIYYASFCRQVCRIITIFRGPAGRSKAISLYRWDLR